MIEGRLMKVLSSARLHEDYVYNEAPAMNVKLAVMRTCLFSRISMQNR